MEKKNQTDGLTLPRYRYIIYLHCCAGEPESSLEDDGVAEGSSAAWYMCMACAVSKSCGRPDFRLMSWRVLFNTLGDGANSCRIREVDIIIMLPLNSTRHWNTRYFGNGLSHFEVFNVYLVNLNDSYYWQHPPKKKKDDY